MVSQDTGMIAVNIPVGAEVKQALLYWEGQSEGTGPDADQDTITVNGLLVSGSLIGAPIEFSNFGYCYRADVTDLVTISTGLVRASVSNMKFGSVNNGAGLLIIYDDGTTLAEIDIRDGYDSVFINATVHDGTEANPQTFTFTPSPLERQATLMMFFSSVSGETFRPSALEITIDDITRTDNNTLDSLDGQAWDTLSYTLTIPANASSLTVEPKSIDNDPHASSDEDILPASFRWLAAGLSIPPTPLVFNEQDCPLAANQEDVTIDSDSETENLKKISSDIQMLSTDDESSSSGGDDDDDDGDSGGGCFISAMFD